ncbi:MAG: DUF3656 domain-containing protein, partial [Phycisphaerales bacterium]|nr:DUF3656 domain-containing protein [Phycisphaerales bacterium]
MHAGDKLWKTSDPELDRRLRQTFSGEQPHFQRPLKIQVHGHVGAPMIVVARDDLGHVVKSTSALPLAKAENQPLTFERLTNQFGRLGGTPFRLGELENHLEGEVILPMKEMNRLRRELVTELEILRAKPMKWTLELDQGDDGTAPMNPQSLSENVGQASSLPVHGASSPRVSSGKMPPEPADKMSASHFQTGSQEFVVPDGLEVTLWAESPLFFKPTNIDVDQRGRIWIAEGVNYRTFRGQDVNQPEVIPFRHPDGDRIVILEDTDGDGDADSSKVFVQDKDLVAPLGVAVIGNRVFVSCSPHLIAYTIDPTGDRPAKKEIFLTGFGGHDHDHGLHSVVAGPDGRLYFNAGNAGPHIVTDRDGKTIRAGSIYSGGSPHNTTNTPNMRSDDGHVWTGGLALRVDPDGRHLTPLSHNFRNSYEVAVDSFGDLWQNDIDDEVRACRTSWLMEGGNMGFFSADGTRTWRADQRPGQTIQTAQWHQDDPGVIPAGDIYGAGGPTGVAVYEGDLLPAKFRGAVLNCDAGRNTVFAHRPVPEGAGFRLERTVLLSSQRGSTEGYRWDKVSPEDKSTWFRPSDVAVGTDGAVYVADWHD